MEVACPTCIINNGMVLIDCHRETEVAMEGNEYYTELHDQLKKKYKGEKITVDKIGGIECAKCIIKLT